MRLGAPLFADAENPDAWVRAAKASGYGAHYSPAAFDADLDTLHAYRDAATSADLVIAETGAWCSPLSPDPEEAAAAMETCRRALYQADELGARCCVNVAGSTGTNWAGPHADDLSPETFDRIVDVVRDILDTVKPKHTCYTLETMPWMIPDSIEAYQRLIKAVDRPCFGVHFDPVNLVNSPSRYFRNGDYMEAFVKTLGDRIRSVHLKDVQMRPGFPCHLQEVRPGLGGLDFPRLLRALNQLSADLPVMLEHLPNETEYALAAKHVRAVAADLNITLNPESVS